jgi:hypothetical protein
MSEVTVSIRQAVLDLQRRINRDIIGQERVVERLIIALLANGNVLIEGLLVSPRPVRSKACRRISNPSSAEYSLRRTCFLPTSREERFTGATATAPARSNFGKDPFSATSFLGRVFNGSMNRGRSSPTPSDNSIIIVRLGRHPAWSIRYRPSIPALRLD